MSLAPLVVSVGLRRIPGHDFSYAAPEFLFLFAVGMAAAAVNFPGSSRSLGFVRDRVPWTRLTMAFWLGYLVLMLRRPELTQIHSWRLTFLAAGAMLSTLISCTNALLRERRATQPLLRLFELKPVVALGIFSYSLYLVHAPILSLSSLALRHGQVHGPWAVAVAVLVAVPVSVIFAYGFHLLAEKPFMQGRTVNIANGASETIGASA